MGYLIFWLIVVAVVVYVGAVLLACAIALGLLAVVGRFLWNLIFGPPDPPAPDVPPLSGSEELRQL